MSWKIDGYDVRVLREGREPMRVIAVSILVLPLLLAGPGLAKEEKPASPYVWKNGHDPSPDHFPIGVWLQPPNKAKAWKKAGVNLFVGLWKGPTEQQLRELKQEGMRVVCAMNEVGMKHRKDPTIAGWLLRDEPDNAQSRGRGKGYGPPIPPAEIVADYRRIRKADPTRPIHLNLGQGVAWDQWKGRGVRTNRPEDYAEYAKGADIVSFDIYPVAHTDSRVTGQLWRVGHGVQRLRDWTKGKKIVWNVIECTRVHNPNAKATPKQMRAEAWISIIHGSRGIVWFVHEFQPKFKESAPLSDPKTLEAMTRINAEIRSLAAVINSPDEPDVIVGSRTGMTFHSLAREHGNAIYVFACAMRDGQATAKFLVQGMGGKAVAEVIGENRKIDVEHGRFDDVFRGMEDVHLYRIRKP
jgi:hypothetical protein